MATITNKKIHGGQTPNRYYLYAVRLIKKTNLSLTSEADKFLFALVNRGEKKLAARTRTHRRDTSRNYRHRPRARKLMFYASINKLILAIKSMKGTGDLIKDEITVDDIKVALNKLCPLWPFC